MTVQIIKQFSLGALLSLITGKLLCEFSEMHSLTEHILGHPVWSHEFGSREMFEKIRGKCLSQFPQLDVNADHITRENWEANLAEWTKQFGASFDVRGGHEERTEHPLESLQRMVGDKPVIQVVTPDTREN